MNAWGIPQEADPPTNPSFYATTASCMSACGEGDEAWIDLLRKSSQVDLARYCLFTLTGDDLLACLPSKSP